MITYSLVTLIVTVLLSVYLAWKQSDKLWAFLLLSSVASVPVLTVPGVLFGLRVFQVLTLVFTVVLLTRKNLPRTSFRPLVWTFGLGALSIGSITLISGAFPLQHAKEVISLCLLALGCTVAWQSMRTTQVTTDCVAGVARIMLTVLGVLAIAENLAFEAAQSFSVMPGRPNGLLPEADWFGGVLAVLLIAAASSLFYAVEGYTKRVYQILPLLLGTIALILTVSRSAWLAYATGLVCLLVFIYATTGTRKWLLGTVSLILITLAAYSTVSLSHLTRFPLLQRAASTVTGEQIVTLACPPKSAPNATVNVADPSTLGGCIHITLEEREARASAGYTLYQRPQSDPNIQTRSRIYSTVVAALVQAPIANQLFGFGFGTSTALLGVDGRGEQLNASNVFLEMAYSMGALGLSALLCLLWLVAKRAVTWWLASDTRAPVFLAVVAATGVFSMFNATYLLLTPVVLIFVLYHTDPS